MMEVYFSVLNWSLRKLKSLDYAIENFSLGPYLVINKFFRYCIPNKRILEKNKSVNSSNMGIVYELCR